VLQAGIEGLFGRMWGGMRVTASVAGAHGHVVEGATASEEACRETGHGGHRW
jgi:hypothetical protein